MTVILDYGMGNLRSVQKALERLGHPCRVQTGLEGAGRLVIPGVGAFGAAMERLEPLREPLVAFAKSGKPLLGICLGQQLLFESSEEMGAHRGLGLLPGKVRLFDRSSGLKVPHMGWSPLEPVGEGPLLRGVPSGEQVYFVHSLWTDAERDEDVAAWAEYGVRFPAAVCRENVWGCQFHPEKSGAVGLRVLENFLRCS